jgi:hypothetical protein
MSIEITEFVDVNISVSPTGVGSGNFGILGFLTLDTDGVVAGKEITLTERTRSYTSLASVGVDWAASSEVYKSASSFYGQTPTPQNFTVLMSYSNAQSGSLVGGSASTLTELATVTSGTLDFLVDGFAATLTTLDFSAATSLGTVGDGTSVAAIIQAALDLEATGAQNSTVTHNGYQFVIVSDSTGVASTVGYATGTAADALGLSQILARSEAGIVAETPLAALNAAADKGVDWVGTDIHKSLRDVLVAGQSATVNSMVEIAAFCEASKRIFMNTTNDLTVLSATTGHAAAEVKAAAGRYTLTSFSRNSNLYPGSGIFGRAASVNFSGVGTTITLNLKQISGVTAESVTPAEFAKLRENYVSCVVQVGNTANAFTDSRMASGSWLDTTHGIMWLENKCEADMFNLMYQSNTKIPYTQTGINTTVATLERSLQAAVRNGLAGPGFLPDGTYLPEGYVVNSVALANVPPTEKGNRLYSGLTFKMVGTGALHEVSISGEFSE